MASLYGRPHGFKNTLRTVQLAFVEIGFEQLNFGIASLCEYSKLQSQLFTGHYFADQVGVQQKLIRLIYCLLLVPC